MQQHHTRQSHMRLLPHTNNIQIHPAPVLPGQPPTQPQQQHLKMPVLSQAAAAGAQSIQHNAVQQSAISNAPPHMRDQAPQNRGNNRQPPPTTTAMQQQQHNQTAQIQKLRQHTNQIKNNNNINNKSQYGSNMNVPPQQQQQQNNSQPTHNNIGTLHQQQPPQHQQTMLRNMQNAHQYNTLPTALKQILPSNENRSLNNHPHHQQHQHEQQQQIHHQQHHQQYGYNYGGNKPAKYNDANNSSNTTATKTQTAVTTFSTPKAILQNPNRLQKSPQTSTTKRSNNNNNNNNTKILTNNLKVIKENATSSNDISNDSTIAADDDSNTNDVGDNESLSARENFLQKSESNTEANKENVSDECSNHSNNKILCNDDSIAKNTKEKTPMCLVNELARYNKIVHQYRLTGEKGPAHSKRFTVTLKLGSEEYTAEGFKIKKAQHAAASLALEKTSYKHPIPKAIRNHDDSKPRPFIMPTVELNALAMKLGQQTYYLYDPRQMPPPLNAAEMHEHAMHDANMPAQHYVGARGIQLTHNGTAHLMPLPPQPQQRLMNEAQRHHFGAPIPPPLPPTHLPNCPTQRSFGPPFRGGGSFPMMNRYQRYPMIPPTTAPPPPPPGMPQYMHHTQMHNMPMPYKITLIVGKQKFVGIGRTLQHAKHDAASRALQVLKTQQLEEQLKEELDDSMDENDVKSPISQVHEAGIKRNLTVHFKILREDGPAHMRNFITACIMGSLITEGEGHGKKISKKRAAEKMLQEIKKLPPVTTPQKSPTKRSKAKTPAKYDGGGKDVSTHDSSEREVRSSNKREKFAGKERPRKVHEDKEKAKEIEEECPITKLLQLMQQRKQKEPVFEYIAKSGNEKLKRREFIVEVTAQGYAARGTGVNKKIAKRNAAENLLHTLLESDNSGSDNEAVDEHFAVDDNGSEEFETSYKQTTPITVKNSTKDNINVKKSKLLDDLDIPEVSTATQVPGILILRQNKKPTAIKKKEAQAIITTSSSSSTPSRRPVKAIAKRIEVDLSETIESKPKEHIKPAKQPVKQPVKHTKAAAETIVEKIKETEKETTVCTTTDPASTATTAHIEGANDSNIRTATTAAPAPAPTPAATSAPTPAATSAAATAVSASEKPSNSNINASSTPTVTGAPSLMKQQLLYLANLLGFEVNFSDYPKGNHNEFLTIVALNTDPPQMCHGFGQNTNESQNDAARNALKILSDLGLNNAAKSN